MSLVGMLVVIFVLLGILQVVSWVLSSEPELGEEDGIPRHRRDANQVPHRRWFSEVVGENPHCAQATVLPLGFSHPRPCGPRYRGG